MKQVAFIHDGNCPQGYPHIYHIAEHLSGLACVHGAAYNGAAKVPVPRSLVVNPQHNPIRTINDWDDMHEGFVSMQTFKAWKHVHELVQAIAYMPPKEPGELREIAGKGIEYQYMTSIDKCKDAYFHDDPERDFNGERIWQAAEDNGMVHHGYWSNDEVDKWLSMSRALVDPSWSKKYSAMGGHWNRVVVDAMIRGSIPIAHAKHMGDELFQAGVHYIDLDHARDPIDYADIVLSASGLDQKAATYYRDNAHDLLGQFDRKVVAQKVVDLAHGNTETETGTVDGKTAERYGNLMFDHYGVLV